MFTNSRLRSLKSLRVGDRFLAGKRGYESIHRALGTFPQVHMHTVTLATHERLESEDETGLKAAWKFDGYGVASTPPYADVFWTDALPNGDFAAVAALAKVYCAEKAEPLLLHVVDCDENGIVADVVDMSGDVENGNESLVSQYGGESTLGDVAADPSHWKGDIVGRAAFWERRVVVAENSETIGWRPGDLVGASAFECFRDDETTKIHVKRGLRIGAFATREAISDFLPAGKRPNWSMISAARFLQEEEVALARLEPNEALTLISKEVGGDEVRLHVLGSSGITFLLADDIESSLESHSPEGPGRWVFGNATWNSSTSYQGDYDCWLEGDWRPASAEDVARLSGLDMAGLDKEIADWTDLDVRPGLGAEAIGEAEKAHAARASAPAP